MKAFIVFAAALTVVACANECYLDVYNNCNPKQEVSKQKESITHCHAKYGAIDAIQGDIQQFANSMLHRSFDFLLMSTHYSNFLKNRPGFEKLFRGLSDGLWEDGIDTIKYITSRGGQMNFSKIAADLTYEPKPSLELYELQSMGRALDIEKSLAKQAFDIHKDASGHRQERHDPEIAHHLEEAFMEKHRETIRKLAGHAKDLTSLLNGPDASVGLYVFDEYLQKE